MIWNHFVSEKPSDTFTEYVMFFWEHGPQANVHHVIGLGWFPPNIGLRCITAASEFKNKHDNILKDSSENWQILSRLSISPGAPCPLPPAPCPLPPAPCPLPPAPCPLPPAPPCPLPPAPCPLPPAPCPLPPAPCPLPPAPCPLPPAPCPLPPAPCPLPPAPCPLPPRF